MTNISKALASACFFLLSAASVPACLPGDDETASDDAELEETGEAEHAILGDIDCANGTRDITIDAGCDLELGEQCSYITPDNTYGNDWTSGESCQEYMVLEMPTPGVDYGGETMSVRFFAAPYDVAPTTEAECEATKVEIAAYNWDENGDLYELIGTASKYGTWNGSSCSLGFVFLYTTLNCNSAGCEMHPFVAARAFKENAFGLPIIRRVVLGADRTDM